MSAGADTANRADDTSSPGLSSPPSANSPAQPNPPPTDLSRLDSASRVVKPEQQDAKAGGVKAKRAMPAETASATRKPRKKREPDGPVKFDASSATSAANVAVDAKPVKQRAKRGTSAAYKKKVMERMMAEQKAEAERAAEAAALHASRASQSAQPAHGSPLPPQSLGVPPTTAPHQNGNLEAIQNPITNYTQNLAPQQQHVHRPASGQNYDPIRSSTVAPRPSSPLNPSLSTPTKLVKHSSASASPSISSLIDPPDTMRTVTYSFPENLTRGSDTRTSLPPEAKRPRISPPDSAPSFEQNRPSTPNSTAYTNNTAAVPRMADAMDVDTDHSATSAPSKPAPITIKKSSPNASTAISSTAHSPKPVRPAKEAPIALPGAGSGLLSGSIFGGNGLDAAAGSGPTAPTVVLEISLTGESNQYINFSELAEKRYGFNALHPRLAAQRDRLARVAAAGAAIENAHKNGQSGSGMSADEKSVDLSNDEGEDSNVEMGGMNGGKSGEGDDTGEAQPKPRKKRMMKEDMYDKDDGFVDDTELAWEEQAAVSKDGFFVYSGLLVPEGEEAKVERADGAPKRGGRGGGRGSRGGGRGGGRGGASAAGKDAGKDGKAPTRKSRTTKADKERLEREKAQRENLAPLASKPLNYPLGPQIPA